MLALSPPAVVLWAKHGFVHPKRERGSRTPHQHCGTSKYKRLSLMRRHERNWTHTQVVSRSRSLSSVWGLVPGRVASVTISLSTRAARQAAINSSVTGVSAQ